MWSSHLQWCPSTAKKSGPSTAHCLDRKVWKVRVTSENSGFGWKVLAKCPLTCLGLVRQSKKFNLIMTSVEDGSTSNEEQHFPLLLRFSGCRLNIKLHIQTRRAPGLDWSLCRRRKSGGKGAEMYHHTHVYVRRLSHMPCPCRTMEGKAHTDLKFNTKHRRSPIQHCIRLVLCTSRLTSFHVWIDNFEKLSFILKREGGESWITDWDAFLSPPCNAWWLSGILLALSACLHV